MLKCLKKIDKAKTGIFAAGVLFGTAGIKVLSSKDAKKLYTNCTAAVLRAKRVCHEDCDHHPGERRGYLRRSSADQRGESSTGSSGVRR